MIALPKELLKNTFFIESVKSLKNGGFITAEQFIAAKMKTPVLKTQRNYLVRFGFLLLGFLLYSSFVGVISLFAISIIEYHYELVLFLYAIAGILGCELLSRNHYYGYGLDDAFVMGFLAAICTAIGVNTESATAAFATAAIFGLFCCLRYVNAISALVCVVGITGFFCSLVFEYKILPQLYLPFIGLLLAVAMYVFYYNAYGREQAYFYKNALRVVQVFSLILGYASINYFVVRELSVELMGIVADANHDIPFAAVFYILTFAVPILYLGYGLKQKNRKMFLIGLLSFGCSILTIRHYYSVLPPETALILAGLILFGIAYFAIRKLRNKESGITFERDRHSDKNTLLYAQVILANSQISVRPMDAETGDMPFGGGGFSGGGAGETY